jgi:chorismate mutase
MAPGIRELRDSINHIDRQLLELLAERMRFVMKVGEIKRAHGLQVYDAERERELLERVSKSASTPLEPDMARRIFECVIQESRDLERRHVETQAKPG